MVLPLLYMQRFFYTQEVILMQINKVQIIKERLTMHDIMNHYGFPIKRRIPCPLHCGDDDNFEIKINSWRCYSRCGSGDVISFVQKLFGLSFADTLKKIDTDFNLGLYADKSFEDLRWLQYKQRAEQAKREREEQAKQNAEDEYWSEFDTWVKLEKNKRLYAPKSPDEEPHPLFLDALQKLSYQEHLVDEANARRQK